MREGKATLIKVFKRCCFVDRRVTLIIQHLARIWGNEFVFFVASSFSEKLSYDVFSAKPSGNRDEAIRLFAETFALQPQTTRNPEKTH